MPHSPPDPCLFHRLPEAPDFLGRETELKAMRSNWESGVAGVLALVGLGGSGKTALAARFLVELMARQAGPRPGSLFVWSFYQEPDPGLFLRELHRYFTGDELAAVRGAGLLHPLQDSLQAGGRHLLVLDGLERVQQARGPTGNYGRLDDPLLRALLVRCAEGLGRTLAVVTSRFPLTDLRQLVGYRQLDVEDLQAKAATELLRRRGVLGDEGVLADLVKNYGAHPLTLDHLGTLIGQFLGGDPARAPEVPTLNAAVTDRQAARLARLFAAYERHLPERELALLCRLAPLRRGVDEARLLKLFLCTPAVQAHTVRETIAALARLPEPARLLSPDQANWIAAVGQALEEALCATPLAGPENAFKEEICDAVATTFESCPSEQNMDIEELARLYAGAVSTEPDEQRPLTTAQRTSLRGLYGRYCELRRSRNRRRS